MSARIVAITLTEAELTALRALARKGRVFMDVDPAFLGAPAQRAAALSVLGRLRQLQPQQA